MKVILQRKFITTFSRLFSLLVLICLLISSGAFAHEIETETVWARLLHFEYSFIRQDYVPAVFNSEFYLSQKLPTPKDELQLSIQQFAQPLSENSDIETHPICRFPARALFLKKYYGLQLPFELKQCPSFWQFKSKIDVESVALVFSSYYIDNASSAFGHTLLRLKRRGAAGQDLLDYGVSYAAMMTTKNPILYGIYGIFGGFWGNFSMTPYFFKIREYNDMQSRDLWEYTLDFSEEELSFLVAHLWELDKAHFTYYYLRQNCAFKLLQLFDIVRPSLNLVDKLGYFVIPVDTVQALFKAPGLVTKVSLRPSAQHKLEARFKQLTALQKEQALEMMKMLRDRKFTVEQVSKIAPEVLDTLIDATDYLFPDQLLLGKGQDVKSIEKMKMILLTQRSKLSEIEYLAPVSPSIVSPHEGLPSRRWELGTSGSKVHGPAVNMAYRFALQDALELGDGHAPNTELEMGNFFFRYLTQSRRFYVHDARLVSVIARKPWSQIEKPVSWMLRFGAKDLTDTDSIEFAPYVTFGVGPTWSTLNDKVLFSTFLYTAESYSAKFERHNGRADLGLRPSFLFHLTSRLAVQQEWTWTRTLTGQKDWSKDTNLSLQWTINQQFSLQAIYHYQGRDQAEVNLLGYL